MSNSTCPLFTSAFSLRSILSIKPQDNPNGPGSISSIAKKYNLKKVVVVESNMTGFLEFSKYLKDVELIFGLRLNCKFNEYDFKMNVFAANTAGTKELQKIYTKYSVDHDSAIPIDVLQSLLTDNLEIALPFYDSLIHKNLLGSKIFVDFGAKKPTVFIEDNSVLFDTHLAKKCEEYAANHGYEIQRTKSIYYENFSDFDAWVTYMAIQKRAKFEAPEMPFCDSDRFCMEAWAQDNKQLEQTV